MKRLRKAITNIPFGKIGKVILAMVIIFIIAFVSFSALLPSRAPDWTGFGLYGSDADPPRPKTLWDWLDLLIIPLAVVLGGWWLNEIAKQRELKRTNETQQREAIRLFFDRIENSLVEHQQNLLIHGNNARQAARGRIRNILAIADRERKIRVFEFLYEAALCRHVAMSGMQLSKKSILHGFNFEGQDFEKFQFNDFDFEQSILKNAKLKSAVIRNCNFRKSLLDNALFDNTVIEDCDFSGVREEEGASFAPSFQGAEIRKTNFREIKLHNANFDHVILADVDFTNAELDTCSFIEAEIQEGEMSFEGVTFRGANLTDVSFPRYCNLRNAIFNEAILTNASFIECDLTGANFIGAFGVDSESENFRGATLNDVAWEVVNTDLPSPQGVETDEEEILGKSLNDI